MNVLWSESCKLKGVSLLGGWHLYGVVSDCLESIRVYCFFGMAFGYK